MSRLSAPVDALEPMLRHAQRKPTPPELNESSLAALSTAVGLSAVVRSVNPAPAATRIMWSRLLSPRTSPPGNSNFAGAPPHVEEDEEEGMPMTSLVRPLAKN